MPLLHDPFDLLDTDIKVAPILPASKLDEMVTRAMTSPQMVPLPVASAIRPAYRVYGGIAIAACLLLTFGFLSKDASTPDNKLMGGDIAASYSIQPKQKTMFAENDATDFNAGDISDYVILATFEDQ